MNVIREEIANLLEATTDDSKVLFDYYTKFLDELEDAETLLRKKKETVLEKLRGLASESEINSHDAFVSNPAVKVEPKQRVEAKPKAKQLEVDPSTIADPSAPYNKNGTWGDKIEFVLRTFKKPMKSNDIVSELLKLEKLPDSYRPKYANGVKAMLSQFVKKGERFATNKETKEYFLL